MKEKRMEDMIHEALEGGGGITQAKGHDQKLIVALMSLKGSLGNICLFHTYLVVAQTKIQFSEELGATQFIQEVINDRNGNLSLMVSLLRARKSGHIFQEPSFFKTMTTCDE
jgi:hypothetical protein